MARWAIVDAGIDCSGALRGEERAPAALRAAGLVERLRACDAGEVDARVRDTRRDPDTGVVGALEVRRASTAISTRVGRLLEAEERPLVVGGDCTLLLGVVQALPHGCGLWFVDGHADFFDGESSPTGEAADMELAILTGHGPHGLLEGGEPLIEPVAVVLLGHRPAELHPDVARENARLDPALHALTTPEVRERGAVAVGTDAAARLEARPAWLHLDLDVLDEACCPLSAIRSRSGSIGTGSSPSSGRSSPRPTSVAHRSLISIRTATPMAPTRPVVEALESLFRS
jgi:arginase